MREAPAKKAAVAHCARKCLQRRFAELDNDSANSAKSFGIEYNSRSQKHIVHNFQCCNIYCNVQTCCNEKYICCNTGMLSNIYCNTWKSVQYLFKYRRIKQNVKDQNLRWVQFFSLVFQKIIF